jgi:hypothetical protein
MGARFFANVNSLFARLYGSCNPQQHCYVADPYGGAHIFLHDFAAFPIYWDCRLLMGLG